MWAGIYKKESSFKGCYRLCFGSFKGLVKMYSKEQNLYASDVNQSKYLKVPKVIFSEIFEQTWKWKLLTNINEKEQINPGCKLKVKDFFG